MSALRIGRAQRSPTGASASRRAAATVACLVLGSGALAACEAPAVIAEPSGDLRIMADTWDLELPASAVLEEHHSSEHGPHGERDAVYVLSLDASSAAGHWDPTDYTSSVSDVEPIIVRDIVESAAAPWTDAELQALRCRSPEAPGTVTPEGNDHLATCIDPEDGTYVIFERIF